MTFSEEILVHVGGLYCDILRGVAQFISDIPTVYWVPLVVVSGSLTLSALVYAVIGLLGHRHS